MAIKSDFQKLSKVSLRTTGTRVHQWEHSQTIDEPNEKPPSTSTLAFENSLPAWPVPTLQQTMEKFLTSVKPVLTDQQYLKTKEVVREFSKPGGTGEKLQQRLINNRNKLDSWLADRRDNKSFFENPLSVVIWSSPGLGFQKQEFTSSRDQLR